jgi:hypothetical protein
MSAQVEKLTAALAAAKAAIRTLKAESGALKVKFKEELKATKTSKKPAVKKATKPVVKKTPSKVVKKAAAPKSSKVAAAKKVKSAKIIQKVAPVASAVPENKVEENVTSHHDIFSPNE